MIVCSTSRAAVSLAGLSAAARVTGFRSNTASATLLGYPWVGGVLHMLMLVMSSVRFALARILGV